MSRSRPQAGFSLLEVMIALAILGLSLTALSRSQQNSIRAANRAKLMTVAVMLARYKMIEIEDQLFEEGFSDFEEEEKGDFKEEGFKRYTYVLKVDKVELPTNLEQSAMSSLTDEASGESSGDDEQSPMGGMMALGGQMIAQQFEMIRNVLEESIRRVQLRVIWKEGTRDKEVSVAAYFTDSRVIDTALSGGLSTPGQGDDSSSSNSNSNSNKKTTSPLQQQMNRYSPKSFTPKSFNSRGTGQ